MSHLDTTIIILQLLAATLPSLGVLAFVLLHRRQTIHADLADLQLRQEHEQLRRLQDAKQTEFISAAVQAYAPALTLLCERALAKRKASTAAELSNEQLLAELRRRSEAAGVECDCDECAEQQDPINNPIN